MSSLGKISIILAIIFVISSVIAILTGPIQLIPKGFESANINLFDKAQLSGVNVLEISTPDADVNVYPINGSEFDIKLTGTYAENKYGSNVNLSVEKIGDKLEVKVVYPNLNFVLINRDFNLDIGVPENYSGELFIVSASGNVKIEDLDLKNIKINTASGEIEVKDLISENTNIESVSGNIDIENLETEESEFKSVSGEIEISDSKKINAIETTSGNIQITNYLVSEDMNLESVSGEVRLDLIDYSSIDLKFESVSGDLENDFGEIYGGENKISVETTSGDLRVY